MSAFDEFLHRNEQFAQSQHRPELTAMPSNPVFVVTCLDPRVEPAGFLGIGVGDAIVLRNPGGRVSDATVTDISLISFMGEFLGADGPPMEVAVVHHTQCGMGFLANPDFRRGFSERSGIADEQLASWAVTDPYATVRYDVDRLLSSPLATSRMVVSGHVLDLATGLISTVIPARAPAAVPVAAPVGRAGRPRMTAVASGPGTARGSTARRPALVMAVVLVATFVINLDTTIVNVAIPALGTQLHASTSGQQWVIDAYNLAFAGLILTGGTIGDRFGRRRTLAAGLAVFALGSGLAASVGSTGSLISWRVVMGAAAAFIFPTTLSIISQTFPDRAARAKAIGAWGAATGVAVAVGPIAGGALLAHYWWGSIFLALVPVAALTMIGAVLFVPADRPDRGDPLDISGLTVSALALISLVYTVIEAPDRGWSSASTVIGFVVAAAAFAVLIVVERRQPHPMLDVQLFTNLRFTAASGAVTLAFFALSGFIFLIILYFQIMRGYSALEAGVRTLPVAVCIAIASGLGPALAVRLGNKLVVSAGLVLVAAGYGWVALAQTETTSYRLIVAQMILLGLGMGFSTAPATEAILGVVRPEQAGVGSAVNDATRLIGGTLGVAVLGSVYASLYRTKIDDAAVPASVRDAARASYGAGHAIAARLPGTAGQDLLDHANRGFLAGLHAGCGVAAAVCLAGAGIVIAFLPSHPESANQPAESRAEGLALGRAA